MGKVTGKDSKWMTIKVKHYGRVLIVKIHKDSDARELSNTFRDIMLVLGYEPETVKKHIGEHEFNWD